MGLWDHFLPARNINFSCCHTGIDLPSGSDAPPSPMIPVPISVLKLLAEGQFSLQIDIVPKMYYKFCKRKKSDIQSATKFQTESQV